jgi:hypothetical protein
MSTSLTRKIVHLMLKYKLKKNNWFKLSDDKIYSSSTNVVGIDIDNNDEIEYGILSLCAHNCKCQQCRKILKNNQQFKQRDYIIKVHKNDLIVSKNDLIVSKNDLIVSKNNLIVSKNDLIDPNTFSIVKLNENEYNILFKLGLDSIRIDNLNYDYIYELNNIITYAKLHQTYIATDFMRFNKAQPKSVYSTFTLYCL